jgi:hypothetical protein
MKISNIKENFGMRIEDPFWNETFTENLPKWIHIWLVSITIISSIVFAIVQLTSYVGRESTAVKVLASAGLVSSTLLMFNRDTFLPFLSESFIPQIFLNLGTREPRSAERAIVVKTDPNAKVIFWAADPGKDVKKSWKLGYNKFENSGVAVADKDGNAKLPIICPSRYIVHGYKVLPKHLHYRSYNETTQMLSRIQTVVLDDKCM